MIFHDLKNLGERRLVLGRSNLIVNTYHALAGCACYDHQFEPEKSTRYKQVGNTNTFS